jgi:hypothetical protein
MIFFFMNLVFMFPWTGFNRYEIYWKFVGNIEITNQKVQLKILFYMDHSKTLNPFHAILNSSRFKKLINISTMNVEWWLWIFQLVVPHNICVNIVELLFLDCSFIYCTYFCTHEWSFVCSRIFFILDIDQVYQSNNIPRTIAYPSSMQIQKLTIVSKRFLFIIKITKY